MDDKLKYTPNYVKKKYPLFRLKLSVKNLDTVSLLTHLLTFNKSTQSFKASKWENALIKLYPNNLQSYVSFPGKENIIIIMHCFIQTLKVITSRRRYY